MGISDAKQKLMNEKPVETMVLLRTKGPSYPRKLSQETDTTYSHMVRLLEDLEECGLIKSSKKGRKKIYELTRRGQKLGEKLRELQQVPGIEFDIRRTQDTKKVEDRPKLVDSLEENYI